MGTASLAYQNVILINVISLHILRYHKLLGPCDKSWSPDRVNDLVNVTELEAFTVKSLDSVSVSFCVSSVLIHVHVFQGHCLFFGLSLR